MLRMSAENSRVEDLSVEGHRRSLRVLRHFVSVVEVVAEGRLFVFVHQIRVGAVCSDGHRQQAVHNDVSVPAERPNKEIKVNCTGRFLSVRKVYRNFRTS